MDDCCIVLLVYSFLVCVSGTGTIIHHCIQSAEESHRECQRKKATQNAITAQPVWKDACGSYSPHHPWRSVRNHDGERNGSRPI